MKAEEIEKLKEIIRSGAFQESHLSSTLVVDLEATLDKIDDFFESKENKDWPTKEVVFFKLKEGKYLAENGKEVTTEMLFKSEHALYHDSGYLIVTP